MIIYIGYLILIVGLFFILTSFIGMIRFPDFFSKVHAASITDSFAIPFSLVGLSMISTNFLLSIKLLIIAILYLILSPLSANSLAKAAYLYKDLNNKKKS
jgi:multicomponent Na+:H+ antiporter subunit G